MKKIEELEQKYYRLRERREKLVTKISLIEIKMEKIKEEWKKLISCNN